MVEAAPNLREQHAYVLGAQRRFDAKKFFDYESEGMFLVGGRNVIQAIKIMDGLQIRFVFDQFLPDAEN